MKWFKIFGDKWFMGSTRWELSVEQRSVWVDLLARASINEPPGRIDYFSLEQLAHQFNISLGLLQSTLNKCEEHKKIKHDRKKKRIIILNWKKYQSEYERQRPYRQQVRGQSKMTKNDDKSSNKVTPKEEGEGEEKEEEKEEIELEKEERRGDRLPPQSNLNVSPLLSASNHSPSEKNKTVKDMFLSMLMECVGYPFDEIQDSMLFDITVKENPDINILNQTEKKINWWKEHPEALKPKANPRKKLFEWFCSEQGFQERGGPQQIGEILRDLEDLDHRNFIKKLCDLDIKK